MPEKLFRTLLTGVCVLAVAAGSVNAAWVDDWIEQKTMSGPGYLETQKRGYMTFGNFSARWQTGNDYLVSINKPQFKAGCGGIDLMVGGVEFLDKEYLADKLANVVTGAMTAFIYDITMSVLSEKVATSMKSLSAIADRLNQLQFDDCKAGQAIAATIVDAADPKVEAKDKTQAMTEYAQQAGLSDLWHELKNYGEDNTVDSAAASAGNITMPTLVSGCPLALREVFFSEGSLLSHLAHKRGYNASYIDLVRGLIGDVRISPDGMQSTRIERCPENTPGNILDLIADGSVYIRDAQTLDCRPAGSLVINGRTYHNLRDWVFAQLNTIGGKFLDKGPLSQSEEKFLDVIPAPIYKAMITELTIDGSPGATARVATRYSDYVAILYAYFMLGDLYNLMDNTLATAEILHNAKRGTDSGEGQSTCKIELAAPAMAGLAKMQQDLIPFMHGVYDAYQSKLAELNSTLDFARAIKERDQAFKDGLSERISRARMLHQK